MADEQTVVSENEQEDGKAKSDRYYWCRLKRDFFKSSDIQIIEAEDNGIEICLFYLKALCESIDFNGRLMITENKPHTEGTIAAITRTNIETVKAAIRVLQEFGLMDMLDGNVMFMTKLPELVGSESKYAKKKADQRKRKKENAGDNSGTNGGQCPQNVPQMSPESGDNVSQVAGQCPTDIEKELDSEKELEKEKESKSLLSDDDSIARSYNEDDSDDEDMCMKMYGKSLDYVTGFINRRLPNEMQLESKLVNKLIGQRFDPYVIIWFARLTLTKNAQNPIGYFINLMKQKDGAEVKTIDDIAELYFSTDEDRDKLFDAYAKFVRSFNDGYTAEKGCA